jgi:uncharacterized HAD superfamily protein
LLNRWEESLNEKVCAFDIDGVLNYYPQPWVDFLNQWLDTTFADLTEAKDSIPYSKYRELKFEYRESGYKAKLQVREGAVELTRRLKEKGYTILILTARPFHEHKSLFKQTIDWLNIGDIRYDGIIFGRDKHIQVLDRAPSTRFIIEDHRYYANLVAKWGYRTFLLDNRYNRGPLLKNVVRINKLLEVISYGV